MAKGLNQLARMITEKNSDSPQNLFNRKLTKYIESNQKEYKPSVFYKPSGVSGCIRKMYFERIGQPLQDKASYNLIAMGENGTIRHEVLQQYLVDLAKEDEDLEWLNVAEYLEQNPVEGTVVDEKFKKNDFETKCKNALMQLSFLCDGLIKFQGKLYILEIKTETMFKYTKHDEPYHEHKMQAACYGLCLGVSDVMFLYENRDNYDKKAYTYHITPEMEDEVLEKIQECEGYVELKQAPLVFCNSSYCPYCHGEGRKLK